jgi:hypothetical protein
MAARRSAGIWSSMLQVVADWARPAAESGKRPARQKRNATTEVFKVPADPLAGNGQHNGEERVRGK